MNEELLDLVWHLRCSPPAEMARKLTSALSEVGIQAASVTHGDPVIVEAAMRFSSGEPYVVGEGEAAVLVIAVVDLVQMLARIREPSVAEALVKSGFAAIRRKRIVLRRRGPRRKLKRFLRS